MFIRSFVEFRANVQAESQRRPWGGNDEERLARQGYKKDSNGFYQKVENSVVTPEII
jgi:hypothetical protein